MDIRTDDSGALRGVPGAGSEKPVPAPAAGGLKRWDLCYGVMEKQTFGVPADNVGASSDFDRAKQIADKGTYRWVCEMWKSGGIWHWGDEVLYRSFFWPGRRAYENYPKPREG